MAAFLGPLNITELTDTTDSLWRVDPPHFQFQSDAVGLITVPVGFQTDFASVPRIGWIYALVGDTAHEPALIHDWLYYSALYPRATADNVLLEGMNAIGMAFSRRWAIYLGVRIGGWVAWDNHRNMGNSVKDFPNP